MLILLSDIDGLYTDDPHSNPDAELIKEVSEINSDILSMAKGSTGSDVGTGGMATKLMAAKVATESGADMIIANASDISVISDIFNGDYLGTKFVRKKNPNFNLANFIIESIG